MGQHPTKMPICFQPLSLQRPQPHRAVLQSDQAMSSGRDTLRQACRQLPCHRPTCINQAKAALMSPRPGSEWRAIRNNTVINLILIACKSVSVRFAPILLQKSKIEQP
jgi:hypothetical protein